MLDVSVKATRNSAESQPVSSILLVLCHCRQVAYIERCSGRLADTHWFPQTATGIHRAILPRKALL